MVNLPDLLPELQFEIFTHLPDAQAASRLSQTCTQLHSMWARDNNRILSVMYRRRILAFDEALDLAKAESALTLHNLHNLDLHPSLLGPKLRDSERWCARVLPLYEQDFEDTWEDGHVYDAEQTARVYFRSRLVSLGEEHPHLRRSIRRRLKRQSEQELTYHSLFLGWWVQEMRVEDIRAWHDMGVPDGDDPDIPDGETSVPFKWHFATDTVSLYCALVQDPGQTIGQQGLWSNKSGQGFQPLWW